MPSKVDRFAQWRGSRSATEQPFFNTALHMDHYVDSVKCINVIKRDFQGLDPERYQEFSQYDGRSFGTLLFIKLMIDELMDQSPDLKGTERELLVGLSELFAGFYENPKRDPQKNISDFIDKIDQLLAMDMEQFMDKKQSKNFLFSFYILMQIIRITLESLDWRMRMMVGLFIDVDPMKERTLELLQKIEEKAHSLQHSKVIKEHVVPQASKIIQSHFNKQYLALLNNAQSSLRAQNLAGTQERLQALELNINSVASNISTLIKLRKEKTKIDIKLKQLQKLETALDEDEQKVIGKKGVNELIKGQAASYKLLMAQINAHDQEQFIAQLNQLNTTDEAHGLSYKLNLVASPLVTIYHTTTPQSIQNTLRTNMPYSADRACKIRLHELTKNSIAALQEQSANKNQRIETLMQRLSNRNAALKKFINDEPSEHLAKLREVNDAIQNAVSSCRSIVTFTQKHSSFIRKLDADKEVLSEFIRINDGMRVRISNFLACFSLLFKSDTARMLDRANELKHKLDVLKAQYQYSLKSQIHHLDDNLALDDEMKNQLKLQFSLEEENTPQVQRSSIAPNQHNVALLMNNLSRFFATNPKPFLTAETQVDEADIFAVPG